MWDFSDYSVEDLKKIYSLCKELERLGIEQDDYMLDEIRNQVENKGQAIYVSALTKNDRIVKEIKKYVKDKMKLFNTADDKTERSKAIVEVLQNVDFIIKDTK